MSEYNCWEVLFYSPHGEVDMYTVKEPYRYDKRDVLETVVWSLYEIYSNHEFTVVSLEKVAG